MSRNSTIIMWVAVILMFGVYFLPLWSISLDAPQYPEGMGMRIWLTKITGEKPHDLQNINGLNHYIGMKEIHAESIPELRFMKYIVAVLIAMGAGAALLRRRWALAIFVSVALVVAIVGLADFYRWSYDYGHDLDPDAPIKVPGMTYQPPLIGSKVLLNITATSLPGAGGLMLMIAVGMATVVLVVEVCRRRGTRRAGRAGGAQAAVAALLALSVGMGACTAKPAPIEYGVDACTFCKMTISDQKYGAEILTKKGRVRKYDAIECMVQDVDRGGGEAEVSAMLTVDFASPGELVDATTATYLHSPELRSPMALNLTSFAAREAADAAARRYTGRVMSWSEAQTFVQEAVAQRAPRGR